LIETIREIKSKDLPNSSSQESPALTSPVRRDLTSEEQLRELEESRKCKACHDEESTVVFIPCGHLSCCTGCAEHIEKCPGCKRFIREKVQTALKLQNRVF